MSNPFENPIGVMLSAACCPLRRQLDLDPFFAPYGLSAPGGSTISGSHVIQYEAKRGAFSEETMACLEAMGHPLRPRNLGNAQVIVVDPETGLRMGGPDPRREPPSHAAGH